jgi:hypothetical protein
MDVVLNSRGKAHNVFASKHNGLAQVRLWFRLYG